MTKIESFTASSIFPSKLLHKKVIKEGRIIPIHAQLIPTNKCNLNCEFCSYKDREKELEINYQELKKIISILACRGTGAITWTGGGEPLLYDKINEAISYAGSKGIQSGLVTNGILLDKLKHHLYLTWCRISSSDDRVPFFNAISKALKINPKTDWAFSHVVTKNPNYKIIKSIIDFANKNNFTHVRLVSDLCDLGSIPSMDEVKKNLGNIDDSKVIYQGRKDSTRGTKNCYISLMKPTIGPEGVFPCCGTNYAIKGMERRPIKQMKMGDLKDLPEILDKQKQFDGRICDVCYYSMYNDALTKLLDVPEHLEFI